MHLIKYRIGDKIWAADTKEVSKTVICPDCAANKYLTVILGNEDRVTIECKTCRNRVCRPTGYVSVKEMAPIAMQVVVKEIKATEHGIYYTCRNPRYTRLYGNSKIFDTEEEAKKEADRAAEKTNAFRKKQRENKSCKKGNWGWTVSYHREQIRIAKKNLKRAKANLRYAESEFVKEKKNGN